jgi:alpha-glucosidase
MRSVLDEYDDRVMVGEIYLPNEELVKYYGTQREDGSFDECHLPFNFQLITLPWKPAIIKDAIKAYYDSLPQGGWPNWVMGNHDQHRIASRIGLRQARIANMLLLTLWGTPTTYYGEEIGMENVEIPAEFIQDPPAVNQPEIAHIVGRDPERTPMQWDDSPNAGFTSDRVTPWLPLHEDYCFRNVKAQGADPSSMLNLYKKLIEIRKEEPALSVGDLQFIDLENPMVIAYKRFVQDKNQFLIVLNFSNDSLFLDLKNVARSARIEVTTNLSSLKEVDLSQLFIDSEEGLLLRIT